MINFSQLLWKSGRSTTYQELTDIPLDRPSEIGIVSALRDVLVEKASFPPKSPAALLTDPQTAGADRLRYLRMRLRELRQLAKLKSLVITSPLARDGKSTVAMSLATTLAEGGKQGVLLIEADLHHPSLASRLGLRPGAGLAKCLEERIDPLLEIRKLEPLGWFLLQAGEPESNPTELLQSDAFSTLMQRVSPHFDWILIDTPPAIPITDALSLSRHVDATLLVTRASRTPRNAIEETLKLIGRKHVVGIVLNGAGGLARRYSEYYDHPKK